MNAEALWNIVVSGISHSGEELQTITGLWFRASSLEGKLYVSLATDHTPSSKLSRQRPISKKEFIFVHSYYNRWAKGESGVRREVSRKSRNTAYVFALIDKFDS